MAAVAPGSTVPLSHTKCTYSASVPTSSMCSGAAGCCGGERAGEAGGRRLYPPRRCVRAPPGAAAGSGRGRPAGGVCTHLVDVFGCRRVLRRGAGGGGRREASVPTSSMCSGAAGCCGGERAGEAGGEASGRVNSWLDGDRW